MKRMLLSGALVAAAVAGWFILPMVGYRASSDDSTQRAASPGPARSFKTKAARRPAATALPQAVHVVQAPVSEWEPGADSSRQAEVRAALLRSMTESRHKAAAETDPETRAKLEGYVAALQRMLDALE